MMNQKLVEYIKSELSRGISLDQIKSALLPQGWSDSDVNEAINLVQQGVSQTVSSSSAPHGQLKKSSKLWILIPILIVLAAIGVAAFFIFSKKEPKANLPEEKKQEASMDTDQDGLPDSWEKQYGLKFDDSADAKEDLDQDGLINLDEYKFNTDPIKQDTDGDGYLDGQEVSAGYDPIIAGSARLKADAELLTLNIVVPKSTYAMGEAMAGNIEIKYTGRPFQGIVLRTYLRQGFDKKFREVSLGPIPDEGFEGVFGFIRPDILQPFMLDQNIFSSRASFDEEGIYTYTISVYDCQSVEETLHKNCGEVTTGGSISDQGEELLNISPLKSVSQSITVSGGKSLSECKANVDCTRVCEGCEKGKQICEQANGVCLDCLVFDRFCKQGYKCKENKCVKEITQEPQPPQTFTEKTIVNEGKPIDCGSNFDCFINASQNCDLVKVMHAMAVNLFGIESKGTLYYELKGMQAGKCVFYIKRENYEAKFSDELVQQMLAGGATQEQIQQQEKVSQDQVNTLKGKDGTCQFNTNDLTALLNRWKAGSFSSEDFSVAKCEGSYFSSQ